MWTLPMALHPRRLDIPACSSSDSSHSTNSIPNTDSSNQHDKSNQSSQKDSRQHCRMPSRCRVALMQPLLVFALCNLIIPMCSATPSRRLLDPGDSFRLGEPEALLLARRLVLERSSGVYCAAWLVVYVCSPLAVVTLALAVAGILVLRGSVHCSRLPHWVTPLSQGVAAVFWLFIIGVTSYLVAHKVFPMIAFLVFAVLAVVSHTIILTALVRRFIQNRAMEQPRQQLLIARDKTDAAGGTGGEAHNPFKAPSIGVIPGTSNLGYILWLPHEDSGTAAGAGPLSRPPPVYSEYQAAPSPSDAAGERDKHKEGRARLVPKTQPHS